MVDYLQELVPDAWLLSAIRVGTSTGRSELAGFSGAPSYGRDVTVSSRRDGKGLLCFHRHRGDRALYQSGAVRLHALLVLGFSSSDRARNIALRVTKYPMDGGLRKVLDDTMDNIDTVVTSAKG